MKWLRSTNNQTYTAEGKVIPSYESEPLQVTDDVYAKMLKMTVIKSLIDNGGIIVMSRYEGSSAVKTSQTAKLQQLSTENARLNDRIRELEAQSVEDAATTKEVKAAQKAQAEAEKKLAELQAKYAALEAEANAKIAELSKGAE